MQIRKLKVYQIVEAVCADFVSEGLGICHIETEDFKPLTGFVLGVLPGERFLARVTRVKSNHFHGVVLPREEAPDDWIGKKKNKEDLVNESWAIFNPSADRIVPPCSIFTFCGSCKMLHMDYEKTIEYKKKWLKTQLERNHVTVPEIESVKSPRIYHYRNHVQIHINKHKERGFYAPYSYTTKEFPPEGCHIFDQKSVDEIFPEELELERCVRARIDYVENKVSVWSLYSKEEKKAKFTYTIEYPKGSKTKVTISNESFFQTNTSIIPDWLEHIEKLIDGSKQSEEIRILELFSGFGFITNMISMKIPLKSLGMDILSPKSLNEVTIENPDYKNSSSDFKKSYIQNDITLLNRITEDNLGKIREFSPNLILVNPPRSGFMPSEIEFLFGKVLANYKGDFIYSSCNGATFARDAKKLNELGFELKEVSTFDFFPWTSHYEVLGRFVR